MAEDHAFDLLLALQTLNYTARLLVSELDPERLTHRALDALVDFGRCRRVALLTMLPDGAALQAAGVLSADSFVDPDLTVAIADSPLAEVIAKRQIGSYPAVDDAPVPLPRHPHEPGDDRHLCLCMPLVDSRATVIGVVTFERPAHDPLSYEERQALSVVGTLTAVALENARLFTLATTDGLTGLYVRRFFEIRLREELARSRRHGGCVGLVMTDIDHFKKFNDTYGHQQGDVILRELAGIYRLTVRKDVDIPCRYGGEEFVAILPATDLDGALRAAERLRAVTAEHAFPGGPEGTLHVTLSAGVAVSDGPQPLEFDELLSRADQALYRAKDSGRNRVVSWADMA
jgi:diguanylate cyclase (GGDEF)-like protein